MLITSMPAQLPRLTSSSSMGRKPSAFPPCCGSLSSAIAIPSCPIASNRMPSWRSICTVPACVLAMCSCPHRCLHFVDLHSVVVQDEVGKLDCFRFIDLIPVDHLAQYQPENGACAAGTEPVQLRDVGRVRAVHHAIHRGHAQDLAE